MNRYKYLTASILLLLVSYPGSATETMNHSPAAQDEVEWRCLSAGGNTGEGSGIILVSVVGQTATGVSEDTDSRCYHGFLQDFQSPDCCVGLTGNVDGDPSDFVDIGDLTALVDYLYITFTEPTCMGEANIDGDQGGIVDIGDLTALIDYLWITFTPLAECL